MNSYIYKKTTSIDPIHRRLPPTFNSALPPCFPSHFDTSSRNSTDSWHSARNEKALKATAISGTVASVS